MTDSLLIGLVAGFGIGALTAFIVKRPRAISFPSIKLGSTTNIKMVLVVRTDLGMSKGKIAAQCAHAVVESYREAVLRCPEYVKTWRKDGEPMIVLRLDEPGEEALIALKKKAMKSRLSTSLIRDAGRTQISKNSATVVGIGPGLQEKIDPVVGHLKLL